MASMIPDILVNNDAWVDVYSATGITVGVALQIQNKGSGIALVYTGASAPPSLEGYGYAVQTFDVANVDSGEAGCFILARGAINVQQV